MGKLTLIENSPVDFEILKTLYKDNEDLQMAWPGAKYPLCPEEWSKFISSAVNCASLLFMLDKKIIGHLLLRSSVEGELYLCFVYLDKAYRGQGLIYQMIQLAIDFSVSNFPYDKLWLHVDPGNLPALKAYEKMGFEKILVTEKGRLRMAKEMNPFRIFKAETSDLNIVKDLFVEYAESLDFDLGFQDFETELKSLPGSYASPRGRILLAYLKDQPAGCVAMRPLSERIVEMKRLYIKPDFRGLKLGKYLVNSLIEEAKSEGYEKMRLDTVETMKAAISLYETYGFYQIGSYTHNPIPGCSYWEKIL
jgi:ribosomal protein S18 acetylase RimI-like enzyme